MSRIGLLFEIDCVETRFGEVVRIVGDRPELGSWNPYDAETSGNLLCSTGVGKYPRWGLLAPVWIQVGPVSEKSEDGGIPSSIGSSPPITPTLRNSQACRCNGPEMSVQVEYKYIKDRRGVATNGPELVWEDDIENRRIQLPPCQSGTIWLISDARFDEDGPPRLTRASLQEVLWRWGDDGKIDPEWTTKCISAIQRDAPEWADSHPEYVATPQDTPQVSPRTPCSFRPGRARPPCSLASSGDLFFEGMAW